MSDSHCGCGGVMIWAAVPTESPTGGVEVVAQTQCRRCDLNLPRDGTVVHVDGREFAYHATRDCEHVLEESDWAVEIDTAKQWAVPCTACFGRG